MGPLGINIVFVLVVSLATHTKISHAQNCPGSNRIETFDKVTGVTINGVRQRQLYTSIGNTVTAECNNRCRSFPNCTGFLINYEDEACYRMETNVEDIRAKIVPTTVKSNYFEKVCLKGPGCDKAWIFERVPGFELDGYDDKTIENVGDRVTCQDLCLDETKLPCRSIEYDYSQKVCRLSTQTRRSQPASYRPTTDDVDYLENQCQPEPTSDQACHYLEYDNQDLGYADLQSKATSKDECEKQCDSTIVFNCRSYTFFPETSVCRLSGDDNISAGPTALEIREGANYYQRAPCVDSMHPLKYATTTTTTNESEGNLRRFPRQTSEETPPSNQIDDEVSLVCTATSMTITLNTEEAFTGKLFAFRNPKQCAIRGTGTTQTALTFEYEDPNQRCGTEREAEGVFTNTIVVQHHPIIQQKGDRAIKLYCFFEIAGDKVVTNSYDVIAETVDGAGPRDPSDPRSDPGIPTSIVNGTAPQPQVLLRIVNAEGQDITGTKLGEPLFLRIELDGESIFDIFARNLIAQSGLDDEEIKLLDERGCPTDPVFPGLRKEEETGALLGRFEAFKFSETSVVNFQVNVQFCQDRCNPVDCGEGVQSFGKRRRRRDTSNKTEIPEELAEKLVYDPDLNQEIIYFATPLRKQIRVDSGTKVDEFKDESEIRTAGNGVFVEGEFEADDVFCASWTVVIVTAAAFVFLQFCILVVCVLCIFASRRSRKEEYEEHYAAIRRDHPSSTLSQSGRSESLYQLSGSTYGPVMVRPVSPQGPHPGLPGMVNTAHYVRGSSSPKSTLRSLRTSYRD
ncbi:uncharacterized protein LOC131890668 isoform X2 [Tigriopus californicus]|uniref:uncharacterized protein LOC131890668 isoform X2 n=1 Tax=Tigriopus californicus TaxID=6832 RepID=UPI0027DA7E1E|nr:uncharacterized protein LOC131890668 isoform X2 [Tigriopus californicus]